MIRGTSSLTAEELEEKIVQLKNWYSPTDTNPAFHSNKTKCVRKLNYILKRVSRQDIQKANFKEILICVLTLIYYFGTRLKLSRSNRRHFSQWYTKRHLRKAETVLKTTLDKLLPECSEATVTIIFAFFSDVDLWPFENLIIRILKTVLYFMRHKIDLLNMMLTDVDQVWFHDVEAVRHRLRVLYELLNSEIIILETPKVIDFIRRLLDYYTRAMLDDRRNSVAHDNLNRGFEICLRQILDRVLNQHRTAIISKMLDWYSSLSVNDEDRLQFSLLVQYAAEVYKVGLLCQSLPDDLVVRVLTSFVGSENPLHSLVGCYLIQHFLDRQLNAKYLVEPKLYYAVAETQIKLSEYNENDRQFINRHKEKLHEYFIHATTKHCENSTNLKAVFTVVCCMVLEVPCDLTAESAASIMMVVQDFALNQQNISSRCRHWMHAIVISVMSLICWVHKAPVLNSYVNQIVTRRAQEAPQLNPPLLQEYDAKDTINTKLFLQDWELQYGLWKAFSLSTGTINCLLLLVYSSFITRVRTFCGNFE